MLDCCENILKLLRRTEDMFEEGSKLGVRGYTNADFISDVDGRMSTSCRSMEAEYTVNV